MNKSPILAFFLALIPGFGHMYLGKRGKGFLYTIAFFALFFLGFLTLLMGGELLLFLIGLSGIVWGVNVLDMVITLLTSSEKTGRATENDTQQTDLEQNERFFTILLSFIPGVGHFHLGLNQRGLTFLTGFLGIGIMVLFVTVMTETFGFMVFLLILPIIWIYSLFDVIQLMKQKENGEPLEDRTIMEDLDRFREGGRKSKVLATLLGIFPGAGHMYMGLQRRGLQLMVAFLLSIYVLDVLRLSLFLFLIPIIWFYSFFDTLQQGSRMEREEVEDTPIVKHFMNHQRWFGILLVFLGIFFIVDRIVVPILSNRYEQIFSIDFRFYYNQYFQLIIVSLLFIGGGIRLLAGSKQKKEEGS